MSSEIIATTFFVSDFRPLDLAWLLLFSSVFAGALIQGTLGVGFALVVVPVMAWMRPEFLPVAVLLLMQPINMLVIAREHRHIDWSGIGWVSAGRFFGTFVGLWLLAQASARDLDLFIGAALIATTLASLFAPSVMPGRKIFAGAGLVTGITETATGIGGPPLALAFQRAMPQVMRPTVAICMAIGQLFSLLLLGLSGLVPLSALTGTLVLVPATVLGLWLSRWTAPRLAGPVLRRALLAFAFSSGLVLLICAG
jgi:uncharacterized protein